MNFENLGELFLAFLNVHKGIAFFLVLGIGYLIGNIRIGSFSLGSVAGVLFAGLIFGYFGFRISSTVQMVGVAFFDIVKANKDILTIIALCRTCTQKEIGFRCES